MQYLEGDCLQLSDGSLWVVKGSYHPPRRIIALPRLVNGRKLKRVDEALTVVHRYYRHFMTYVDFIGRAVPAVPEALTKKHLRVLSTPCPKGLGKISELCSDLLSTLSTVCGLKCGVAGSLLYGAVTEHSDIDIVCIDNSGAYECLNNLRKNYVLKPFSYSDFLIEYTNVSEGLSFNDHLRLSTNRITQGVFKSRRYTLRLIDPLRERALQVPCLLSYRAARVITKIKSTDYRTPSIYTVELIRPQIIAEKVLMVTFRVRYTEIPKESLVSINNAFITLRQDGSAVISLDVPDTCVKILT